MINIARPATVDAFARAPLPKRFCNLDRLLHAMKARGLDGIVATAPWNVFYLTAFNGIAHKSDEPRPYAVILSRHLPGDVSQTADVGRGFAAVPSRDDATRPARAAQ